MIEVITENSEIWRGNSAHWQKLTDRAVNCACQQSPFDDMTSGSTIFSISVKLSNDQEVQQLNRDYRNKDKPTNVLSFPMMEQSDLVAMISTVPANAKGPEIMLGDIILAYETCAREADHKHLDIADHFVHLVVHGTLHLLGYDHQDDETANIMEALEIKALATMGVDNPYSPDHQTSGG